MQQESTFLTWLSQAATFTVNDTRLRITTTVNEVLFFMSTPPTNTTPVPPDNVEPPVDPVPPQAAISAPRQADVNQQVTFDGSASQSAVGITAYSWDLGDGAKATGATVTHAYANPGDYQVVLTVTDANNLQEFNHLGHQRPGSGDPRSTAAAGCRDHRSTHRQLSHAGHF